jgi:poly-gamma-glutamate synthesis protein (capsule biosynthesis protein)
LIDSGAVDVIHGHSSHHAKALECRAGKVIIYGCGDFVNDYEGIGGREDFRPWLSPMYFVTFDRRSGQVERVQLELMHMRRFRLTRASVRDRQWLTTTLNRFSEEFATCFEMSNAVLHASPCDTNR